ncbi:MAG: hypothetical protein H7201_14905 [Candidatus Saccharibacteria bacterium]|nr:hypothetical protein [Microbacteriaceae bacterium]
MTVEVEARVEARAPRRGLWPTAIVLVVLVALAASAVAFNVGGLGDSFDRVSRDIGAPWHDTTKDTDGDGIPDDVETEGWQTRVDGVAVTDPDNADTDGDGLPDGVEAGELTTGENAKQRNPDDGAF